MLNDPLVNFKNSDKETDAENRKCKEKIMLFLFI
jgi:hypothetical protein